MGIKMPEKNEITLTNDEWKKLKEITDELINYLDFNYSIIESVSQLKLRYDKVVNMYNIAVENKDQKMLESVKDKLIGIFKETIRIPSSNERVFEDLIDCHLPGDF